MTSYITTCNSHQIMAVRAGKKCVHWEPVNSNSNWTCVVLNLPYSKETLKRNITKTVNSIQEQKRGQEPQRMLVGEYD